MGKRWKKVSVFAKLTKLPASASLHRVFKVDRLTGKAVFPWVRVTCLPPAEALAKKVRAVLTRREILPTRLCRTSFIITTLVIMRKPSGDLAILIPTPWHRKLRSCEKGQLLVPIK